MESVGTLNKTRDVWILATTDNVDNHYVNEEGSTLTRLTTSPPRECAINTRGRSVAFRTWIKRSTRVKKIGRKSAYPSICTQIGHQAFGMVVDLVLGDTSSSAKRCHICIVPVYHYSDILVLHKLW